MSSELLHTVNALGRSLVLLTIVAVGPSVSRQAVAEQQEAGTAAERARVYIGTYTNGASKGIYRAELNLKTGQLTKPELAAEARNPSFVALHPNGKCLYAVAELEGAKQAGMVAAFAIDNKGNLTSLNQESSRGSGPCYLIVDRAGKNVLVANYNSGSVAVLPIGEDGRLKGASSFVQHSGSSVNRERQQGPHAHSINLDAAGKFAIVADLGLDKMLVYRFDAAQGKLTPNDPPFIAIEPGSGPRHFAFHPSGRFAYVINEIASTVTALAYDANEGVLKETQTTTTLPEQSKGNSTAEVQVHPSGKFLYGSNRGHNSLAIFAIDQQSGRLTPVGHQSTGGKTPRNFGIDPTGLFILAANQSSDNVVVFRVDQQTGRLTPTGQSVEVPAPVCIKFLAIK